MELYQFSESCGVWLQREGGKGREDKRLRKLEKALGILESSPHPTALGDLSPVSVSLTWIRQDSKYISCSPAPLHWGHCSTGDTIILSSLSSDEKTVE